MKIKNFVPVLAALITISFCSCLMAYDEPSAGSAFYANFLDRFKTTGAIAPSSPFLANGMVKKLAREAVPGEPLYILEIGAGDGVFTAKIAEYLERKGVDYRLYAVDIDETFLHALVRRFRHNKRVFVCEANIIKASTARDFKLPWGKKFDVIISGLPFYADFFSAEDVHIIFENYKTLLKPGGLLRWFSYIAAPELVDVQYIYQHAKTTIPLWVDLLAGYLAQHPVEERQKKLDENRKLFDKKSIALREKCAVIDAFKRQNGVESSGPILNLPLARVHECRLFGQTGLPVEPRRSQRLNKSSSCATLMA